MCVDTIIYILNDILRCNKILDFLISKLGRRNNIKFIID